MIAESFVSFAVERHKIWQRRQDGTPGPWTADPVLRDRKFTNVFRAIDPGTQFILTDLFEPDLDPRDTLMRAFLYRHTGRIETWELLPLMLGGYPLAGDLEDVRQAWHEYRGAGTTKTLMEKSHADTPHKIERKRTSFERTMFTNAYLVFPQSSVPGTDKLDSIVDLAKRLFTPGSPDDVVPRWLKARTQAERFKILRSVNGVGDFMAMQVLTDWGYQCGTDREDLFVVPGPGAIKGAKFLAPSSSVMDTLKWAVKAVREHSECPRLGYRLPSVMDVQNLLCEFSKYHRFQGQATPSKKYEPAHPGPQPQLVLPSYYTTLEDLL